MASESSPITSAQFVRIFKRFDKDGNGTISISEVDEFLKAFEDEGLKEHSAVVEIGEKIKEETGDENVVYMTKLIQELVPDNFLISEFGDCRKRITSVDFMKLWNTYDADGNGFLDVVEMKKFFYDMITKNQQCGEHETPDELEKKIDDHIKVMHQMLHINGDRVYLEDMCKFCPVEENFLEQYEVFTDEEFEEIFAHYDQDKSNEIEGCELEGFLKDLYDRKHRPGQSFEKFTAEKLKKFDKNKDKKFSKNEVKALLAKSSK